eukprot:TRINITY_DN3021_c0_g1_i1.p1 TRINITY_DN3021_c0_g1~~TRINITY_DN3021_c0_g1_i1.p1  ORF type:complete len:418 (-),score=81.44 TRINITY_DN3021_c0_g1_i1:121-1374(-)
MASPQFTLDVATTKAPRAAPVKVLLLENISPVAVQKLQALDFEVTLIEHALNGAELQAKLAEGYQVLGVRSKSKVTAEILENSPALLTIGCFCIGTNQVDLVKARELGIAVFNSPFQNSRSVAELIISQIISLARRLGDHNKEMHNGKWTKTAKNSHEIRGATLGIIGYGHIGSQLSVLAEGLGLKVVYCDVKNVMPLGNARQLEMDELLKTADYVTLHVPQLPSTKDLIGEEQIQMMKPGSYLLNASRGNVVTIPAAVKALKSGHLHGAYFDVYPTEPGSNKEPFESALIGCPNTILSPHIGGSTLEAQINIGTELAEKLYNYVSSGTTDSSVNMAQVSMPYAGANTHRLVNVHRSQPGVLKTLNDILASFDVMGQVLLVRDGIGYFMADVDHEASTEISDLVQALPSNIKTRILY